MTYNDPVVFFEYAIDTADACRELGIATVAVTAGYMCPAPREEFYRRFDAANVDLKGFTDRFYRELCGGDLASVLDTLVYLRAKTKVWVEITTLLIPGENDGDGELDDMTRWLVANLGADVPLPTTVGTPMTWTATATGGVAPLQYQFWRYSGGAWTMVQDYSSSNTYAWTPGAGDVGYNAIEVWVRSAGSTSGPGNSSGAVPGRRSARRPRCCWRRRTQFASH